MGSNTQQTLLKLLLTKAMWERASGFITEDFFPDQLKPLYRTLVKAHNEYQHDLTPAELEDLHYTKHPTLTTALKVVIHGIIESLESAGNYNPDVAEAVLKEAWKQEQCRRVINAALDIAEGRTDDWDKITGIIEGTSILTPTSVSSSTDINNLLDAFNETTQGERWNFNLNNLQHATDGLPKGSFGIVAARPEAGKTAFWVSLCMGEGGFIEQGAKVHIWRNEEPARMVMRRLVSCFLGIPQEDVVLYQNEFKAKAAAAKGNVTVLSDDATAGKDVMDLELYLKNKHQDIDVLIIDQLDNLLYRGEAATDNAEVLGKLYAHVRMLANKYGVAIMAITQAGSQADGKLYYGYNELYGSKTNKAATGDYVFCIGASKPAHGEQDDGTRALNFAKNKLKGPHKPILYTLNYKTSTIRI